MIGKKYYTEPSIVVISMKEHTDIIQTSGETLGNYKAKLTNIKNAKKAQIIEGSDLFK